MNLNETLKTIDGFLSAGTGNLLYSLAKQCNGMGVIVEIGTWKGKSTVCLAMGSLDGKKINVYTIDPHTGSSEHQKRMGKIWTYDEFIANMKRLNLDRTVNPIVDTSENASKLFKEKVELIFIDGAHEYEYVEKDFKCWYPKMVDEGIMAFHDSDRESVIGVLKKYVYGMPYLYDIKTFETTTYAKKQSAHNIIKIVTDKIYGRTRYDSCVEIYKLASTCTGNGIILEIGSFMGRSTICLAMGSIIGCNVKVHSVDPHKGWVTHVENGIESSYKPFMENIKKMNVADMIIPYVMKSNEAINKIKKPIEIIYISASNIYENVISYHDDWYDKLLPNGIIIFEGGVSIPGQIWNRGTSIAANKILKSGKYYDVREFNGNNCSLMYGKKR